MVRDFKDLLLKDIGARVKDRVMVHLDFDGLAHPVTAVSVDGVRVVGRRESGIYDGGPQWVEAFRSFDEIKPYLRRLSSMTGEEKREFKKILDDGFGKTLDAGISGLDDFAVKILEINASSEVVDWLNKKMFAYRVIDGKDMFELGLALEVTKENNPYEKIL